MAKRTKVNCRIGAGDDQATNIQVLFHNDYTGTYEAIHKTLDEYHQKLKDLDAQNEDDSSFSDDLVLTHGIAEGAVISGLYGISDIVYNERTEEYILVTKSADLLKYSWSGYPLGRVKPTSTTNLRFNRIAYNHALDIYCVWTRGKTTVTLFNKDFNYLIDTVSPAPVSKIFFPSSNSSKESGGSDSEESSHQLMFLTSTSVVKYAYLPTSNNLSLQEVFELADIEAEGQEIEQFCADQLTQDKEEKSDKKQWLYLTFGKNCTVIDVAGRIHGTKKNLHSAKICAILAVGASEWVVTGDEDGNVKLWGPRWHFIAGVKLHEGPVKHLLLHPGGNNSIISIGQDQVLVAWNLDTQKRLEVWKTPEIASLVAMNPNRKAFATQGPRKLTLWRMETLFYEHCQLTDQVTSIQLTWHPQHPPRAIVAAEDKAVRFVNPYDGKILCTALIGPATSKTKSQVLEPTWNPTGQTLYTLTTQSAGGQNESSEIPVILLHDTTTNPCKTQGSWGREGKNLKVTAFAYYEHVPGFAMEESLFVHYKRKETPAKSATSFILAGLIDGSLCKLNLRSGNLMYKTVGHSGQVTGIVVNPELSQFVSMGSEPGLRVWKCSFVEEAEFIPLIDITWQFPIAFVAVARELIGFALTHPDTSVHKMVVFDNLKADRYDQKSTHAHAQPIVAISACKELYLFCTASLDETVRIWNEKNHLIRVLRLNCVPSCLSFVTPQSDIYVGAGNSVKIVPADIHLTSLYRNRVMSGNFDFGGPMDPVPLNTAKAGQDPRMWIALEQEQEAKEPSKKELTVSESQSDSESTEKSNLVEGKYVLEQVRKHDIPEDSKKSRIDEKLKAMDEDLILILEGKHPLSTAIPDPHTMSKKEWDEFGQKVFANSKEKGIRKFFISEPREAARRKLDNKACGVEYDLLCSVGKSG